MRPDRFERILTAAINTDGRLTARTYAEAGFTRSPRGIIATTRTGVPVNIQIVGRLADGERHDHNEQPITGTAYPARPVPDPAEGGSLDLAVLEKYLTGLIIKAAPEEIQDVRLYQQRDTPGSITYGATITYHSGAVTFLYVFSAGSTRHEDFVPPAKVSA